MLLSATYSINLVALATGLWLGLYLVTRSPRSWISWLTGLTIWSLSGHFLNVLLALAPLPTLAGSSNVWLQGWSIIPAVVFWHHATTLMRFPAIGFWRKGWLALGYGGAAAAVAAQIKTAPLLIASPGGDPLYLSTLQAGPLYALFLALGLIYTAVSLVNLAACSHDAPTPILRSQFVVLILATLLACSMALLSVAGSSLGVRIPTVVTSIPLACGVALIGYGLARYSALVEGRTIRRDFYHAAVATGLATALYLGIARLAVGYLRMAPVAYSLAVVLAVTTHFLVDAARYHRDASLHRRDARQLQAGLHKLAGLARDPGALDQHLSVTLESLCSCAQAIFGLIVLFEDGDTRLAATHNWRAGDLHLSRQDLAADDVLHLRPGCLPPPLAEAALLIPLYGDAEQLGALLLGRPANGAGYSPADVAQFLYPSERLGDVIWNARRRAEYAAQVAQGADTHQPEMARHASHVSVEGVEDALRHLANYGYLGDHALAQFKVVKATVAASTVTHLDVGKAVYRVLSGAIEKLRPGPGPTADPPPREWHPYLILHDAYVEGTSNRDIMSRLYISHGTFNRTRRAALRALARALEEMEAAVAD